MSLTIAINPVMAQSAAPIVNNNTSNLQLDANQTDNYARLIFKWKTPKNNRIKIRRFPSVVELQLPVMTDANPQVLQSKAGDFVVGSNLSANKQTLRLALAKKVRIETSKVGNYEIVDLIENGKPSPKRFDPNHREASKPNLIEELTANKGLPQHRSTLDKRLVNHPAPKNARVLAVESSQSKLFTRVAIKGIGTKPLFARKGDRLALTVKGLYALDVGQVRVSPPKRVNDIVRYNDDSYTSLVMDVQKDAVVRTGFDKGQVFVDIFAPGANIEDPDLANIQDALNKEVEREKNGDIPDANDYAQNASLEKSANPKNAQNDSVNVDAESADKNASADAILPEFTGNSGAGNEYAPPPFQDPQPSGNVNVESHGTNNDYSLDFNFENNAPSAIFRRGANIFIIFGTNAKFNLSKIKKNTLFSAMEPIKGDGVSGVKITVPDGIYAAPSQIGKRWVVSFTKKMPRNMRTIAVSGEKTADGDNRLKAKVPDAVTTGRIADSDVGDTIMVGLAYGPPSAIMGQQSFLEANFIPTFHGLAVIPRSDDLAMQLAMDGFVVGRPDGMELSNASIDGNQGGISAPGFVDFDKWRMGSMADFNRNLDKLRKDSAAEINTENGGIAASLNLARFYLAWEMGEEALGQLKLIASVKPELERNPQILALQGAAQAMMGRGRDALITLSAPELADDAASHLWATLAAQDAGDPNEARRHFALGIPALNYFNDEYRAKFLLADAVSALQTEDYVGAAIAARKASEVSKNPHDYETALVTKARAEGAMGKYDTAIPVLEELMKSRFPDIAARAQYAAAMLKYAQDPNNRNETIKSLDALRYAWRGDDLEIDVLRNLGEMYIEGGDLRSGLSTLASASTLRPDLQASRDLRDVLTKEFRHLFLEGGADGMDSVQALALFYDFRNLTPVGPEGDLMVRGLADKLVGLDLLPQAEELLQHQVNKRLDGYTKGKVATNLAAIYLIDKKPEQAMRAINQSRVVELPPELNHYRRMIEAIALTDLGRNDHALELIEFDKSADADRIRSEIYWRQGDMEQASAYANRNLPRPAMKYSPQAAADILRAALAKSLSGNRAGAMAMARPYGAGMRQSEFAPAFNVITSDNIPTQDGLKVAVDSVRGSSPFYNVLANMRKSIGTLEEVPQTSDYAVNVGHPTDGNPHGNVVKVVAANSAETAAKDFDMVQDGVMPAPNAQKSAPVAKPQNYTYTKPRKHFGTKNSVNKSQPAKARNFKSANAKPNVAKSRQHDNRQAYNSNKSRNPFGFQAPRDPPV